MSGARRFISVVCVVIVFLLGLGLCGAYFNVSSISIVEWIGSDQQIGSDHQRGVLVAGIVLTVMALLAAVLAFVEFVLPENTYAFQADGGEVRVAFSAIEDYVQRLSGHIPGLHEMRPSVSISKGGLQIVNRVVLEHGASIPETSSRVLDIIRTRLEKELGIEEIGSIRVHVVRITHEEPAKEKPEETALQVPR